MSPSLKHLSRLLLAIGALLICTASPALAAHSAGHGKAPEACWKRLLFDWSDGTISKTYPLPCYHQAIAHLPPDVSDYSSAKDDIQRALQAALHNKAAPAEKTPIPPNVSTTDSNAPVHRSPLNRLTRDLTPGGPDSFPLPLLILGALAILLVAAGGAGMVWRRLQDRGPRPQ